MLICPVVTILMQCKVPGLCNDRFLELKSVFQISLDVQHVLQSSHLSSMPILASMSKR